MFNVNCTTDVVSLHVSVQVCCKEKNILFICMILFRLFHILLFQNISGSLVETTNYSCMFNGSVSTSTLFTGDYFDINLPGAEGGDVVSVTVTFENGTCMRSTSANFTGKCLKCFYCTVLTLYIYIYYSAFQEYY